MENYAYEKETDAAVSNSRPPHKDFGFDGTSSESDVEGFEECDCVEAQTQRLDSIPYVSVYDPGATSRQIGYFIPAQPVQATIVKVERDHSHGVKLISPFIYTIHLRHGEFEWMIERRYVDFQRLNDSLSLFRVKSRITNSLGLNSKSPELNLGVLPYTGGGCLVELPSGNKDNKDTNTAVIEPTSQTQSVVSKVPFSKTESQPKQRGPAYDGPAVTFVKIDDDDDDDGRNGHQDSVKVHGDRCELPKKHSLEIKKALAREKRKQATHTKLPHFPMMPDSVISDSHLEERKEFFQRYLSFVLHVRAYRNHRSMLEFLEVSRLSFVHNLGKKYTEGVVKKRPGGGYAKNSCANFCLTRCKRWTTAWFVVKDTFICYINERNVVGDVLLFDIDFKVYTERGDTGGVRHGLRITNMQRDLLLKCRHSADAHEFKRVIEAVVRQTGSIWTKAHRFGSSFPVRDNSYAQWFVDGRMFMDHAANMMEVALEEIFITDWWLNPEIYLKRPMVDNRWKLDEMLKRKAQEGVRIFVLLYKEVTFALNLNSQYSASHLESLHSNIKVLRHPDHIPGGVFTWAHHEKLIIIDQKIAFVGGIDLCYGRWDDHIHRLTDTGTLDDSDDTPRLVLKIEQNFITRVLKEEYDHSQPVTPAFAQPIPCTLGAGVDALSNVAPIQWVALPSQSESPLTSQAKHAGFDLMDVFNMKYRRLEQVGQNPQWKAALKELKKRLASTPTRKLWLGKDYTNFLHKDVPEPEKPFDDYVDRTVIPRMPWHDISSIVYGSAARDAARHFIQRWNSAKNYLAHSNDYYPLLMPKSYENVRVPDVFRRMAISCNAQILRSTSLWSAGIKATETSIHQAYLKMINEAEHYIYIENQFFVSQVGSDVLQNQIAQAICDRVTRAHANNETFRVYIVIPLLPAFEKSSGSLQVVLHWTYVSISKGEKSLLRALEKAVGDYSRYVTFCSLRTFTELVGKLTTELVYIHSKLIITDDRFCLIGSANINDRSQMGDRDSEVALFVEDLQFTPSKMNGKPFKSGAFAGSLRRRLFQEHLGLLPGQNNRLPQKLVQLKRDVIIDVTDPVSDGFFDLWNTVAKKNMDIFENVFDCTPSNSVKTLEEFVAKEQENITTVEPWDEKAMESLAGIQGNLVKFPTEFLRDSDLLKGVAEGYMPTYIFT